MPFTLSHPSAALPVWSLVRRGIIPLAPFAMGAMAPDFEYLLRLEPYALISHSARGLLLFCLPAGLIGLLLWEWLLRPVGRALVGLRAAERPRLGVAYWPRALTALLLGSVSHVTWDAFTHRDTLGPVLLPALRRTAFTLAGYEMPWYNVLQTASSLVGGVVVLAWLWRELHARGDGAPLLVAWRARAWLIIALAAVGVAVWNAPRHGMMTGILPLKLLLGRAVVGALAGAALALVVVSLLHRAGRWPMNESRREAHA